MIVDFFRTDLLFLYICSLKELEMHLKLKEFVMCDIVSLFVESIRSLSVMRRIDPSKTYLSNDLNISVCQPRQIILRSD